MGRSLDPKTFPKDDDHDVYLFRRVRVKPSEPIPSNPLVLLLSAASSIGEVGMTIVKFTIDNPFLRVSERSETFMPGPLPSVDLISVLSRVVRYLELWWWSSALP